MQPKNVVKNVDSGIQAVNLANVLFFTFCDFWYQLLKMCILI